MKFDSMSDFNKLYIVGEHIESGGFGDVFAGTRRSDNHPVAFKFISRQSPTRWRGIRLHNKVNTPGLSYRN